MAGPFLYLSSAQYFLAQLITAQRYEPRYSWLHNTISDLGSTSCSLRSVGHCSPLHALMNSSFVVLGVTMIIGSVLICRFLESNPWTVVGFVALTISGVGTALVGFMPENRAPVLHAIAAALPFLVGNLGVAILAGSLRMSPAFRLYTWLSGLGPLVALGFFVGQDFLGLGRGGMERVVAYPQTIWLMVFGSYLLLFVRAEALDGVLESR